MIKHETIVVNTNGRGMKNITAQVSTIVNNANVINGICQIFIQHTSASLILSENSDVDVQSDLEKFMNHLAPDDNSLYQHTAEGPDDMPSHIRAVLTQSSLSIPIENGKLSLGTWQGIFLWEHRFDPHARKVILTILS